MDIYNDKIIFIYGGNPIDGQVRDGEIDEIKKDHEELQYHYLYLCEYLKNHFKDEQEIQDAKESNSPDRIMYEIHRKGHIGILEASSTPKYKLCTMYMPREITNKQIEELKIIQEQLKEQEYEINVLSDLTREDGIMNGTSRTGKSDLLTMYINSYIQKNQTKDVDYER